MMRSWTGTLAQQKMLMCIILLASAIQAAGCECAADGRWVNPGIVNYAALPIKWMDTTSPNVASNSSPHLSTSVFARTQVHLPVAPGA
eukprot:1144163-Pelagomonas_calceolata.AAC.1